MDSVVGDQLTLGRILADWLGEEFPNKSIIVYDEPEPHKIGPEDIGSGSWLRNASVGGWDEDYVTITKPEAPYRLKLSAADPTFFPRFKGEVQTAIDKCKECSTIRLHREYGSYGSLYSGAIASGYIGSFHLASGIIVSGYIGSGTFTTSAAPSYFIASGNICS